MVEATQADMSSLHDVTHFCDWINEIHRWGLTVHGPSCGRDVQYCIENKEGNIRTSLGTMGGHDSDDEGQMA